MLFCHTLWEGVVLSYPFKRNPPPVGNHDCSLESSEPFGILDFHFHADVRLTFTPDPRTFQSSLAVRVSPMVKMGASMPREPWRFWALIHGTTFTLWICFVFRVFCLVVTCRNLIVWYMAYRIYIYIFIYLCVMYIHIYIYIMYVYMISKDTKISYSCTSILVFDSDPGVRSLLQKSLITG